MLITIIIFACSYVQIMAKAFQQLNVVKYKWLSIPVVSYAMAYCEYIWISLGVIDVVNHGLNQIIINGFALGTGGFLGAWTGMYLHSRLYGTSRNCATND